VDPQGQIWIADTDNNVIRVVDTGGVIHRVAGNGAAGFGGDGGDSLIATLNGPTELALDSGGRLYFIDTGNRRVRRLEPSSSTPGDLAHKVTLAHAATFHVEGAVPGEIVSLFGQDLGPSAGLASQLDDQGKVATQLGDTQVFFDGVPAPLYYVGGSQINAQVPWETGANTTTTITVNRGGVQVASGTVAVMAFSPGLFCSGAYAVALNPDGTVNSSDHPAPFGSYVVLFGTGFGSTSPAGVTGALARKPLGIPLAPVSVTIGGQAADVYYVGDAPGFAGLTQINARVPSGLLPPGLVEVRVKAGEVLSPSGIYMYVH
jgi:uncharacterized protein (TIGR03437 family)